MSEHFQIDAVTVATVVVTTVGIYCAFIALVRLLGSRVLVSTSSFDFACVVAFGAILGRTVLLADPTLVTGVVALATFVALQALVGHLRQRPALDRWLNPAPVLLVEDGELLTDNLRRAHVVEDEVRQAVRRAGAASLEDVQCLVLERNGALSVIPAGRAADPWLLEGVKGRWTPPGRR